MPRLAIASVMPLMVLLAANADAQWLTYPTPGIPIYRLGRASVELIIARWFLLFVLRITEAREKPFIFLAAALNVLVAPGGAIASIVENW